MKTKVLVNLRQIGATLLCLFIPSAVMAGKPAPQPEPTPAASYKYMSLGSLGPQGTFAGNVNASGIVVGRFATGQYDFEGEAAYRCFVVVPEDTDGDGFPDTWYKDDGQGKNALMTDLGVPEGYETASQTAVDINDHGQIVLTAKPDLFVLNPQFNPETRRWEYLPAGCAGVNPWMTRVIVTGEVADGKVTVASMNNHGQIAGTYSWEIQTEDPLFPITGQTCFVIKGRDSNADGVADVWTHLDVNGLNLLQENLWGKPDNRGGITPFYPFEIADCGWIGGSSPWAVPAVLRPLATTDGMTWWADNNNDGVNDLVIQLGPGGGVDGISPKGKILGYEYTGSSFDYITKVWEVAADGTVKATSFKNSKTTETRFSAMNDKDVIVGTRFTSTRTGRTSTAVLVKGTTVQDLIALTDKATALSGVKTGANDINSRGQIIGTAYLPYGTPYILIPVSQ